VKLLGITLPGAKRQKLLQEDEQGSLRIFIYLPFCERTLQRDFSLWTARQARSHVRTHLAAWEASAETTFSHTIASASPLEASRNRTS
jgi:hypothetical protein